MAHYPADTFQEATEIAIEASNQLHGVINGDANAEVTVEDGSKIPSVRKAMVDSLYFKPPIAWTQGEYEDTYNQLREFVSGDVRTWWFAKGATVSTPVLMSTNPHTDQNWTLWDAITVKRYTCVADMVSDVSLSVGQVVETIGYYNDWVATSNKPKGGNKYEIVPSATGVANGGSFINLSNGLQAKGLFVDGIVNVCQFGAKGDGVADDTLAIQNAITSYKNDGGVKFTDGMFRTTSTIFIRNGNIKIFGTGRAGALNYSPVEWSGTMVIGDFEAEGSNNSIFAVDSGDGTILYKVDISGMRIGSKSGITSKPYGIRYSQFSEGYLNEVDLNSGLAAGILFDGVTIFYGNGIQTGNLGYSILFNSTTFGTFKSSSSIWLTSCNFWQASESHICVKDSSVSFTISESWIESSNNAILYAPVTSKISGTASIILDKVRYNGLVASSKLISSDLPSNSSNYTLDLYMSNCMSNIEGINQISFNSSPNTGTSYLRKAHINNCSFYGVNQTSIITSDTANSSAFIFGKIHASTSYGSESISVPFGSGSIKIASMIHNFGFWDMSQGYPIKLPTVDALSYANTGQMLFDSSSGRVAYTASSKKIRIPRPSISYYGDINSSISVVTDSETLVYNAALTTNRSISISGTGVYNGAKLKIVRAATSTGTSTLSVLSLKTLATGQWCEIEYDGSGWILTASGSL